MRHTHQRRPRRSVPVLLGTQSRQLAVIGGSDACIATHPGDMAVAMRVLDATVETVAPQGTERKIPIAEFPCLPGDKPEVDTTLKTGELITAVPLPKPVAGPHIYRKVRDRASYAYALVSVAAILGKDRSGHRHPRARLSAHPGQSSSNASRTRPDGLTLPKIRYRASRRVCSRDPSTPSFHRCRHAVDGGIERDPGDRRVRHEFAADDHEQRREGTEIALAEPGLNENVPEGLDLGRTGGIRLFEQDGERLTIRCAQAIRSRMPSATAPRTCMAEMG